MKMEDLFNQILSNIELKLSPQSYNLWFSKLEPISFDGPHFVECYIIKDGVCVARDRVDVPIKLASNYGV